MKKMTASPEQRPNPGEPNHTVFNCSACREWPGPVDVVPALIGVDVGSDG
jgi:hypothetical protein